MTPGNVGFSFEEFRHESGLPIRLFVPGRICLMGEHSDWAGGYRRINPKIECGACLVCGTNQGLYADVWAHPSSFIMKSVDQNGKDLGDFCCNMEPKCLLSVARDGGTYSYAAGVAYQMLMRYQVTGLVVHNYKTTLPIKKGLSSSAACCVLIARAFNRAFDLKLTARGEMDIAYQGEICTPSKCGRMDQCCAFGSRPVLMTFDGDRLDTTELKVGSPLHLVIVDLQSAKDTLVILQQLNKCYPVADNEIAEGVQRLLGPINQQITQAAISAIEKGNCEAVGKLMIIAQEKFDYYASKACPSQLRSPVLHKLLEDEELKEFVFGGKGVGSQGDGCAQFLCKDPKSQDQLCSIIEKKYQMPTLKLTLGTAFTVQRAVIPVAAGGHVLFPATKAVSPAMFPIIDEDEIAKPAILIQVEELLTEGIEQVAMIVAPHELTSFKKLFKTRLSPAEQMQLTPQLQRYAMRINEIGQRITFIVQEKQEGLGHAIYKAKEFIQGEPFLLMLGDHLYSRSPEAKKSCVRQCLEAYQGRPLIGLQAVEETTIGNYGCATGNWENDDRSILNITEIIEKPTIKYANKNLRTQSLQDGKFLSVFGLYVLTPRVMDLLAIDIKTECRSRGRYELTPSLERLRRESGLMGLMVDGKRFDIGRPDVYLQTITEYANRHKHELFGEVDNKRMQ